ncbi:MAG: hypothetical protein K8S18_07770, partial [Desulfobacula sp.]|nr:hypothetical protein [Desulfobacula sp.]
MKKLTDKFIKKFWRFLPVDLEAKQENYFLNKPENQNSFKDEKHLIETGQWICRAQDSGEDNGVSRAYKASRYKGHGPFAWQPSYPETTGYIIPTMIALTDVLGDSEYKSRAIKMADWELEVQLSSGAVMGSVVTAKPSPAVFNTGQVIFGWLNAYQETNDEKYLMGAKRAGDYLISVQDSNGSFDKGDSKFALKGATTYNARVAWALNEFGSAVNEKNYIDAGCKNIENVLKKQNSNGWFADNCLNDPEYPL